MIGPGEILFIDKPKGVTSFDVVRALQKKLGIKKIGHAGTLDPFATGLLIVGVGAGTKRMREFEALPKTYAMEVLFGKRTDTGDPEGKIIEEKPAENIDTEKLENILREMEGEITLPIPKYSAVKHKGVPLYKYARKGIDVGEKLRTTKIFYLKLLEKTGALAKIEMKAEKGTYARSVAEEIGNRLGVPAMLENLRRTKIGDFDVREAKTIDGL